MQPTDPDRFLIDRMGPRGEGVAVLHSGLMHIPYALPGETVEAAPDMAAGHARLLSVITTSADRTDPFCTVFGQCGGCATQHMAHQAYLEWKRELVRRALLAAGIESEVEPCIDAHGTGRRRVTLHARRDSRGGLVVGFSEARSHALVPITACPVLSPTLDGAFPAAHNVARLLLGSGKPLDLAVTATLGGLDMDVRGHGQPGDRQRLDLIELATRFDLARLSVHGDVLVQRRPPQVQLGQALVTLPAGGFLQATLAGERLLGDLVTEAIPGAKRVADLFAGCGTFTFRLAERATVHAVETDKSAVAALDHARRHSQGLKAITCEIRDLFRRPLHKAELAAFDAVVFDPPRAGAEAQARMLAASGVPRIVAISCSPVTLSRDLRILLAGGYRLKSVIPVDQFRHSVHTEVVAILTKSIK